MIYLDFEFKGLKEPTYNLVCATTHDSKGTCEWWLFNDDLAKSELKKYFLDAREKGTPLCAYNVIAEASALYSLGINPLKFRWIDLYLEYRNLLNCNYEMMYGEQYFKKRGVVKTKPPFNKYVDQDENNSKPEYSLASACYKLLGKKIDTDHKDKMRDLIIHSDSFTEEERSNILDYCTEDTLPLKDLLKAVLAQYSRKYAGHVTGKWVSNAMFTRGEYAARSAVMERIGHPIDLKAARNFSKAVPSIIKEVQEDINEQLDGAMFNLKKDGSYSLNVNGIKEWIKEQKFKKKWRETNKEDVSTSLDAFEDHFSYRHDYPRGNFAAQYIRYKRLIRALRGFEIKPNKDNFFSYVGSDGRVRPSMGIYGSQSARSQPRSVGFIPLKPSWMRVLIQPDKGKAICSIDYSSQEFLLSAIVSECKNMYDSYCSGDVYLYFAKLAGAVPWDGKKEDYKEQRNLFKATTLGISYGMQATGLSQKLTQDTGKVYTEEDAQALIDKFNTVYPEFSVWNKNNLKDYYHYKFLTLPCGWTIWGDNPNPRSINNVPIQGIASSIMRKAVALAQDCGLRVIFTLHDALYFEYPSDKEELISKMLECMQEAFSFYFEGKQKEWAKAIRMDAHIWSPDYKERDGELLVINQKYNVEVSEKYIDERSVSEYERFKKYF